MKAIDTLLSQSSSNSVVPYFQTDLFAFVRFVYRHCVKLFRLIMTRNLVRRQ